MAATIGPGFNGQVHVVGPNADTVCTCCGAAPLPFCCFCSPSMKFPKYYTAVVTDSGSQDPLPGDPYGWSFIGIPNGTYFFSRCHQVYTTGEPDPTVSWDYLQFLAGNLIPMPCFCGCWYNGFYSPTGSAPWTPLGGPRAAGGPPYYGPPYPITIASAFGCSPSTTNEWSGTYWQAMLFRYRTYYAADVREGYYGLSIPVSDPTGADTFITSGGILLSYGADGKHPPLGAPYPNIIPESITFTPSGGYVDCSAGCSVCIGLFGPTAIKPATLAMSFQVKIAEGYPNTGQPCPCNKLFGARLGYPVNGDGSSITLTYYALETSIPGLPPGAIGSGYYNDCYHGTYTDCSGYTQHVFWRCSGLYGGARNVMELWYLQSTTWALLTATIAGAIAATDPFYATYNFGEITTGAGCIMGVTVQE